MPSPKPSQTRPSDEAELLLKRVIDAALADETAVAAGIYLRLAAHADVNRRMKMLKGISASVKGAKGQGWKILLPFLLVDRDEGVIAQAALDIASLMPQDSTSVGLAGVQYLLEVSERFGYDDPLSGAIAAAILSLGDAKLWGHFDSAWAKLPPLSRQIAAATIGQFAAKSIILKTLQCLEKEKDAQVCGQLANSMRRLGSVAQIKGVVELDRIFPVYAGEPYRIMSEQNAQSMGQEIKDRLRALSQSKVAGKHMKPVLDVWLGSES